MMRRASFSLTRSVTWSAAQRVARLLQRVVRQQLGGLGTSRLPATPDRTVGRSDRNE